MVTPNGGSLQRKGIFQAAGVWLLLTMLTVRRHHLRLLTPLTAASTAQKRQNSTGVSPPRPSPTPAMQTNRPPMPQAVPHLLALLLLPLLLPLLVPLLVHVFCYQWLQDLWRRCPGHIHWLALSAMGVLMWPL